MNQIYFVLLIHPIGMVCAIMANQKRPAKNDAAPPRQSIKAHVWATLDECLHDNGNTHARRSFWDPAKSSENNEKRNLMWVKITSFLRK